MAALQCAISQDLNTRKYGNSVTNRRLENFSFTFVGDTQIGLSVFSQEKKLEKGTFNRYVTHFLTEFGPPFPPSNAA